MAKTLHFTLPQDRLHSAFGEVIAELQKDEKDRPYHLNIASALWGQNGYPFTEGFLRLNRVNYHADLQTVDFKRDAAGSRQTINRWVEEQTKDKIKGLLGEGDVNADTRLVLTNAIYFKANWKIPFPKDATKEATFTVTADEKKMVPMMQSGGYFGYHVGRDFTLVSLPYKGDRLSMVLLLPNKRGGLAEVEKKLTAAVLQKELSSLKVCRGTVALPRFTMTRTAYLREELEGMGMILPFSEDADFSGTSTGGRLYIRKVIHKAFIEVDELGTEAAAATAVEELGIVAVNSPPPFSFCADHPFLFLIRDSRTGSLLFVGRVSDPRS